MYSSVRCIHTSTVLCNHYLYLVLKHCHHSKRKSHTIKTVTSHFLFCHPWKPQICSVSIDLPVLETSYKWDYTVNLKGNQPWIFIERTYTEAEAPSNTLATWCKEPTHWKKLGKIEGRRRKGGDREWDGWMASSTQWIWIWANSGR